MSKNKPAIRQSLKTYVQRKLRRLSSKSATEAAQYDTAMTWAFVNAAFGKARKAPQS